MNDAIAKSESAIIAQIAHIREAANLFIEKELKSRGMKGIVPAHGAVLNFLFRQSEPVPIKLLVRHIGRVKSTTTGIVSTLERHGYLFRQGCDQDARSVRIGLTEKGRDMLKDFEEISARLLERVYGNMSAEDRLQLAKLLAQVEANLTN
jgi:MarR family transcriptional regulator, organic hydroperoxide resistance regulator